jgi:cyclophilin family peptidyl-prolyl cis-trans isomerase
MLATYPNDFRFVYRNFPVGHTLSNIATQAAEAAALQGKYWEMHNALFDSSTWQTWAGMTVEDFTNWISAKAGELGLNVDQFLTDMNSSAMQQKAQDALTAAMSAGLSGTPSVFILLDGQLYYAPSDGVSSNYATLSAILQLWKLQSRQFDQCPPVTIDTSKAYTATLTTTKGDIVLELYADKAPLTVNSFIFLADHGWFDNVPWHRVIDGFVAQTGDPSGTGYGSPGYEIKDEISPGLNFDEAGVVGMANSGPNTNGCQFFITLASVPSLDGSYTVFGKVISGMDVLDQLTRRDPANEASPAEPDYILSVTITSP